MKKALFLLLTAVLLLTGCHRSPSDAPILIGDYVFQVEQATGDLHNVRIRYSLRRQDGGEVSPDLRFGSLVAQAPRHSFGGGVSYHLDPDKKTLWIDETQSSGQPYNSRSLCDVTLEDLTFGEGSGLEPIKGTWHAYFRMDIHKAYTELLREPISLQIPETEDYTCTVSSIQLSPYGIHMNMKVSDSDIHKLAGKIQVTLEFQDGTLIRLPGLHNSVRGKQNASSCPATAETLFDNVVDPEDISAVIVCDQRIRMHDSPSPIDPKKQ